MLFKTSRRKINELHASAKSPKRVQCVEEKSRQPSANPGDWQRWGQCVSRLLSNHYRGQDGDAGLPDPWFDVSPSPLPIEQTTMVAAWFYRWTCCARVNVRIGCVHAPSIDHVSDILDSLGSLSNWPHDDVLFASLLSLRVCRSAWRYKSLFNSVTKPSNLSKFIIDTARLPGWLCEPAK